MLSSVSNSEREIIVNILQRINIDVLVTEHFPFGFLFKEEVLFLIKLLKEIKMTNTLLKRQKSANFYGMPLIEQMNSKEKINKRRN